MMILLLSRPIALSSASTTRPNFSAAISSALASFIELGLAFSQSACMLMSVAPKALAKLALWTVMPEEGAPIRNQNTFHRRDTYQIIETVIMELTDHTDDMLILETGSDVFFWTGHIRLCFQRPSALSDPQDLRSATIFTIVWRL